jgi:histidine ammonia-lyase
MAELGSISERRTYQLLAGKRGLPHFLVANPGLNSGFMIPQYTAASIVSRNKQLCTPASVDTIESSQGQEDHVSMGTHAARKLLEICGKVRTVLAIELLCAAQGLDFRGAGLSSEALKDDMGTVRSRIKFMKSDRFIQPDIEKAEELISGGSLIDAAEKITGFLKI